MFCLLVVILLTPRNNHAYGNKIGHSFNHGNIDCMFLKFGKTVLNKNRFLPLLATRTAAAFFDVPNVPFDII